jgi:hypothetical protein
MNWKREKKGKKGKEKRKERKERVAKKNHKATLRDVPLDVPCQGVTRRGVYECIFGRLWTTICPKTV